MDELLFELDVLLLDVPERAWILDSLQIDSPDILPFHFLIVVSIIPDVLGLE